MSKSCTARLQKELKNIAQVRNCVAIIVIQEVILRLFLFSNDTIMDIKLGSFAETMCRIHYHIYKQFLVLRTS